MPTRTDPRRQANADKLKRLKALAIGLSAALASSIWWLVSGTVAATQASATQSTTSQPATVTQQQNDDSPFFGGAQAPSLGGGFTSGQARPMLRSGGS